MDERQMPEQNTPASHLQRTPTQVALFTIREEIHVKKFKWTKKKKIVTQYEFRIKNPPYTHNRSTQSLTQITGPLIIQQQLLQPPHYYRPWLRSHTHTHTPHLGLGDMTI